MEVSSQVGDGSASQTETPSEPRQHPQASVKIHRCRRHGKPKAKGNFEIRLRQKRRERGLPTSSTDEETGGEEGDGAEGGSEQGVTVLHRLATRSVKRYPDNIAIKSGKNLSLEEVDALRVASDAGLPVPRVYGTETMPNGRQQIKMQYIEGATLQKLWPDLSDEDKTSIFQQLRAIVETMRSIPPPGFIGGCAGKEIRDTRVRFTYNAPACRDEAGFNDYLMSAVESHAPLPVKQALARRMRTDHRIVFSHCDLAPRNIIVKDGKIVALIDWEEAGWYPEYWEYVKFFYRPSGVAGDWRDRADEIFPQSYHDELLDYVACMNWMTP